MEFAAINCDETGFLECDGYLLLVFLVPSISCSLFLPCYWIYVSIFAPEQALVSCCCCKIAAFTDSLCVFFCCCCSPYGASERRTVSYDIATLHETPGNYLEDFRRKGETDDQALKRQQTFRAKHDEILGQFSELVGTTASAWALSKASINYTNFVEKFGPNRDSELITVHGKKRKYQTFKLICSELCWCYLPLFFVICWLISVTVLIGYNTKTGKFTIVGLLFLILFIICFLFLAVVTYLFLGIDAQKDSLTRENGAYRRDLIPGSEILRTKIQLLQAQLNGIGTRNHLIQTPSDNESIPDYPPPKPEKSNRSEIKPPLPDGPMPIFVPHDYPEEAMLPTFVYIREAAPDESASEEDLDNHEQQVDENSREQKDDLRVSI